MARAAIAFLVLLAVSAATAESLAGPTSGRELLNKYDHHDNKKVIYVKPKEEKEDHKKVVYVKKAEENKEEDHKKVILVKKEEKKKEEHKKVELPKIKIDYKFPIFNKKFDIHGRRLAESLVAMEGADRQLLTDKYDYHHDNKKVIYVKPKEEKKEDHKKMVYIKKAEEKKEEDHKKVILVKKEEKKEEHKKVELPKIKIDYKFPIFNKKFDIHGRRLAESLVVMEGADRQLLTDKYDYHHDNKKVIYVKPKEEKKEEHKKVELPKIKIDYKFPIFNKKFDIHGRRLAESFVVMEGADRQLLTDKYDYHHNNKKVVFVKKEEEKKKDDHKKVVYIKKEEEKKKEEHQKVILLKKKEEEKKKHDKKYIEFNYPKFDYNVNWKGL